MPTSMISDVYDGSDRSHHAWTNRSTRITRIDFQYGIMFLKILLIFSPFCLFCVPACRHTNSVVFGCQFLFLRSHRYDPDKQPADLYPLPLTVTSQSSQSPAFCPVPLPPFPALLCQTDICIPAVFFVNAPLYISFFLQSAQCARHSRRKCFGLRRQL